MDVAHTPVLLRETVELLAPRRGGVFVDATLGLGGHAEAILDAGPAVRLVGIDRDPQALERARERLARFGERVRFVRGNFEDLAELLAGQGPVAGILADLGVSSLQLDTPERGFSFRFDGPLDMRMGPEGPTAADLVNGLAEEELARIFWEYGDERQSRRIARAIVAERRVKPIGTTGELRATIDRAKRREPGARDREGRVDPATRVFQALRIEVNRELSGLERFLAQAVERLEADGRLVVISYHSLEDRVVKNVLRDGARGEIDLVTGRPRSESQVIEVLTRKPVRPTEAEVAWNPRSRSARLRAGRRLESR
ncbi:MAG TPA: 16S rRNA (cytosine(1402)-N(4))-methyltransferase RsmH [Thermoanaerobaculia bacterium]|nr:16S rRNA (cytosine(1402)-N(4))-methyltransferase RsmH [Thermoanaerobaculia bacterium]